MGSQPLRVLVIHHGTILGGAPISLMHLVRSLHDLGGFEITIASHSPPMRDYFSQQTAVRVIPWPDPMTLVGKVLIGWTRLDRPRTIVHFLRELAGFGASVTEQADQIRRHRPDVVHLNSSVLFSAALAAKRAGAPTVTHVRECPQGGELNPRRRLSNWLIKSLATRVVALSPAEARRLGGAASGKVTTVYNPVDFERLDPARFETKVERQRLGIASDAKVIVSLGGVASRKGGLELIEAMSHVDQLTCLLLAGPPLPGDARPSKGRIPRKLEDALHRVGLRQSYSWYYPNRVAHAVAQLPAGKVRFLGLVRDVPQLLAAADLLVFAGTTPHFPRPVYEAWAMRKPVVVFQMDGVSTNVEDGVDGVVVRERSGQALGCAIRALLDDPGRRAAMGAAGYEKAYSRTRPAAGARRVAEILASAERRSE